MFDDYSVSGIFGRQARAILRSTKVCLLHQLRRIEFPPALGCDDPAPNPFAPIPQSMSEVAARDLIRSGKLCAERVDGLPRHFPAVEAVLAVRLAANGIGFVARPSSPVRIPTIGTQVVARRVYFLPEHKAEVRRLIAAHVGAMPGGRLQSELMIALSLAQYFCDGRHRDGGRLTIVTSSMEEATTVPPHARCILKRKRMKWPLVRRINPVSALHASRLAREASMTFLEGDAATWLWRLIQKNERRSLQRHLDIVNEILPQRFPFVRNEPDNCHVFLTYERCEWCFPPVHK